MSSDDSGRSWAGAESAAGSFDVSVAVETSTGSTAATCRVSRAGSSVGIVGAGGAVGAGGIVVVGAGVAGVANVRDAEACDGGAAMIGAGVEVRAAAVGDAEASSALEPDVVEVVGAGDGGSASTRVSTCGSGAVGVEATVARARPDRAPAI